MAINRAVLCEPCGGHETKTYCENPKDYEVAPCMCCIPTQEIIRSQRKRPRGARNREKDT